jgi:hypothetical protein
MLLKLSDLRAFWQMVWMQYNRRISAGPHNEWVDGWIRQQERVKQAIAAAKQEAAPTECTDTGDEWVDGWIRQQERVKQAIAAAKQQAAPTECTDTGDEWVDGWIKQQQRLRQALAAAKLRNMSRSQR